MWPPSLRRQTEQPWAQALALLLGLLVPTLTAANLAQEATIVPVATASTVITMSGPRIWASQPIKFEDSSFIRLHFSDVRLEGSGQGKVRVIGQGAGVLAEWSFAEFAKRPQRWTQLLPEGYAVVQVEREDDKAVRLQFTIKSATRESRGGNVDSRQDLDNIRDKDIRHYATNPALMGAARSVAKLSFPDGEKLATCTGFMVAPSLLLTNHHCVNTMDTCFGTVVMFGYQRDANGHIMPTRQYDCLAIVKASKPHDYALLQLDGIPGAPDLWGVVNFNPTPSLAARQPLYLVQHPAGEPKRVTLDDCNVTTLNAPGSVPAVESDFGHKCDTESGSSGSPIFDMSHRVVGLHHFGFDKKLERWARENRAVHIGPILLEIDGFLR